MTVYVFWRIFLEYFNFQIVFFQSVIFLTVRARENILWLRVISDSQDDSMIKSIMFTTISIIVWYYDSENDCRDTVFTTIFMITGPSKLCAV